MIASCFTRMLGDMERMQNARDPKTLIMSFKTPFDRLNSSEIDELISRKDRNGRTLLHEACGRGLVDIASYLIDLGADIEAADAYRDHPIHRAARFGRVLVIKILLNRGANLHSLGQDGNTALHTAAYCGRHDSFDFLINQPDIDLDARNALGQSIEQCAASSTYGRSNYSYFKYCLDEKRSQCVAKSPCSLKRKQDFESNENDNRAKLPSINHYRTQSGDYVDSLAKLCVANWLTAKNIPFSVDCSALKLLPIQPTFYLPEARLFIKLSSDNEVCINGKHDCLVITDNELRDLDKSLNRAAVLQSEQIKLLTN